LTDSRPQGMQPETVTNMVPSDSSVIVVEDDENEVFLLQRAFREAQVKNPVLLFRDGQAVIDYLSGLGPNGGKSIADAPPAPPTPPPPALMLLDLKTPRRNGLEVIEWVRAQPVLKRLVVVMMSSSDYADDINRAYDLGCNSYLLKPLGFDRLVEMVKLLDRYWLRTNQKASTTLPTD
jgi:DNA-binding response OmpR family regulator